MTKRDIYTLLEMDTNSNFIKAILTDYINSSYKGKTGHDSKGMVVTAAHFYKFTSTDLRSTPRPCIKVVTLYDSPSEQPYFCLSVRNIKKYIRRHMNCGYNFMRLITE